MTEMAYEIDGPVYDVLGWGTAPAGCTVYVRLYNTRLDIRLEAEHMLRSPKALEALHLHLDNFGTDDRDLDHQKLDWLDSLAAYAIPALRKLVVLPENNSSISLAELQKFDYYICDLTYVDEVPRVGPLERGDIEEEDCEHPVELCPTTSLSKHGFPLVHPKNVEVMYDDPATLHQQIVTKVMVNGQTLFWKATYNTKETLMAVEKAARIRDSGLLPDQLPVTRLYGVVVDESNTPRGQLYHWIDVERHFTWDVVEQAPVDVKQKWAIQIRRILATLHKIGVVWGDVKAENVVLDHHDNIVVLDLEGGATQGWVDEHMMNTMEGDLQGLERMVDYMLNDESVLRARDKELETSYDDVDCDSC